MARTNTKQAHFNTKFLANLEAAREAGQLDTREGQYAFRQELLYFAQTELAEATSETTLATAAAMYNKARIHAIATEQMEATELGRRSAAFRKAVEEEAAPVEEPAGPWAVVNKETREVRTYGESRAKARAKCEDGETVVKTESLG